MEFKSNEEKILYVIESIEKGREMKDLVKDLGYKNFKSLDMFMRREGYVKEKRLGNYLPKNGQGVLFEDNFSKKAHVSTKALEVIQLMKNKTLTPKLVAHETGFESSKEMAAYMKSKGFIWDSSRNNYISESPNAEIGVTSTFNEERLKTDSEEKTINLESYAELLSYLESKKEKLVELIECTIAGEAGHMPRYILQGVAITKSVHMNNQLDQMIRDFSDEKNVSQKEIFEIALIDFLKKYGYHKEVSVMLNHLR